MGVAKHFFEIVSLECQNADISIFLKKEGKDNSTQISLQLSFTCGYAKTLIKIIKLLAKW